MAGKTLDELENFVWGEPTLASNLIVTCHRLRKKPVEEFTREDLRIMIGQKIGLQYRLPRAIDVMERESLAEGELYPGDLLVKVIGCLEWLHLHPDSLQRVAAVAKRAVADLGEEDEFVRGRLGAFLEQVRA